MMMKKNILVVERENSTADLLEGILLARKDYCVFVAKDSESALRLIKSIYFDLVITNTTINVMNTLSVSSYLRDIRKATGGVPVLIYSPEEEYLLEDVKHLFSAYIRYPVTFRNQNIFILEKVEELLNG